MQHIKDVAEAERQRIADYAGAAAREALKKAAESLPTLSALEASSPDSSASSTAFATGAPMISAPEPGATCRMSKRPIKPPETKPSTVLLQETGALSQPSNVEKQVGDEDAARTAKKAKRRTIVDGLPAVSSHVAPEARNEVCAEEPLDLGCPVVESSAAEVPQCEPRSARESRHSASSACWG